MLILLAALSQAAAAPSLPADPVQAALTCRQAAVLGQAAYTFEHSVQFNYYSNLAARALPGNDDYFQRMTSLMSAEAPGVTRDNAARLREVCDQRFPVARRTGPVALPGDAWQRDLMCAGVTTVLGGQARGYGERTGDTAPFNRLQAIAARFQQRTMAGMAAHGVTPETLRRVLGEQIFASLDLGNGWVIATACEGVAADG